MRVEKINLGNGVFRLVVTPMMACENNIPTHVVDEMVKDVIRQEKGCASRFNEPCCTRVPRFEEPKPWFNRPCCEHVVRPMAMPKPNREPDGIDVHVDRPLRENFYTHHDWAVAMAKYRTLEDVAKDCDWKCKEPMKGTHPNYNFIRPTEMPKPRCVEQKPWWSEIVEDEEDDFEDFSFFHVGNRW